MNRCVPAIFAIAILFSPVLPAQDDAPPVIIEKFMINVTRVKSSRVLGAYREPTKLSADIRNVDPSRRVKEVEFQFDVIDKLRRVTKERLFVTITDYGLGDRTIESGKTRKWTADLGEVRFPDGCDAYGTLFSDTECISKPKVNVVRFKDGSTWERKGWRDEPNPNKGN